MRKPRNIGTAGFRLSGIEELILDLLTKARTREMYGLELVEASGAALKRGTIYVTLQRMDEKGLVESRELAKSTEYVGIPRRAYRATTRGERALKAATVIRRIMAGG